MLTNWSKHVRAISRGSGRQKGREKAPGSPIKSPIQQLEWDQLSIAKLYQENRELQSQLSMKNQEVSVSQGHGGSVVWNPEKASRSSRHNYVVARGAEDVNERGKVNVTRCEK